MAGSYSTVFAHNGLVLSIRLVQNVHVCNDVLLLIFVYLIIIRPFVSIDALHSTQQFFSHVGHCRNASWVEPLEASFSGSIMFS